MQPWSPARAGELPLWELGLGLTALTWPAYPGTDKRRYFAIPFPYLVYRGDVLRADGDRIRGLFFGTDRVELDISGAGTPSVRSRDVPAREGMPDLDISFELGPSLQFHAVQAERHRLTAALNLRALVSTDIPRMRYRGLMLNPLLEWEYRWRPGVQVGSMLHVRLADSGYHDFFYGVDAEHVTDDRPAYAGQRGYNGTSLALFTDLQPGRGWRLRVVADYRSLHGTAFRDSPLVNRRHGVFVHLMVSRVLLRSARSVPAARDESVPASGRAR